MNPTAGNLPDDRARRKYKRFARPQRQNTPKQGLCCCCCGACAGQTATSMLFVSASASSPYPYLLLWMNPL
jgi:hypothetical protein